MNVVLSEDSQREALRIVRLLAQGLHPETMQGLEPTNVCQSGLVVRALFVASEVLDGCDCLRTSKPQKSPVESQRHGKPWLKTEDDQLLEAFQQRLCLRSVAARHQRTEGGILSRLVRLDQVRTKPKQGSSCGSTLVERSISRKGKLLLQSFETLDCLPGTDARRTPRQPTLPVKPSAPAESR